MKHKIIIYFVIFLSACTPKIPIWEYQKVLPLDHISPIGFAKAPEGIWIANATGNSIVLVDKNANVLKTIDGFARPMHIDFAENALYIPEYLSDSVKVWKNNKISSLSFLQVPDAPAGVAVNGTDYVMADFYQHQLQAKLNGELLVIGKKGKGLGEFEYPTDVQFANGKIYVADAYNHRGQILDESGKALHIFGAQDKINAATGIFVNAQQIFLTDFEQHRVLVYDLKGNLQQVLVQDLKNPVEVLQFDNLLWIANFSNKTIAVYQKK